MSIVVRCIAELHTIEAVILQFRLGADHIYRSRMLDFLKVEMKETRTAVAIRPLLIVFYCLGFDLNEHQSHKAIQRIYSSVLFGVFAVSSCSAVWLALATAFETTNWNAEVFNMVFTSLSYNIANVFCINAALYSMSWSGIVDLWKALRQLEECLNFDDRFYRTIRRQTWLAIFFIGINVSVIKIIKLQ